MPCYTVIVNSVEFKIENIDILKKAMEKKGYTFDPDGGGVYDKNLSKIMTVDMKRSIISSTRYNEEELTAVSNSIKRAYSEIVIDNIAKKNNWFKKQLNANTVQLVRY